MSKRLYYFFSRCGDIEWEEEMKESSTISVDSTHGLKAGDKVILGPKKGWFKRVLAFFGFIKKQEIYVIGKVTTETGFTIKASGLITDTFEIDEKILRIDEEVLDHEP